MSLRATAMEFCHREEQDLARFQKQQGKLGLIAKNQSEDQ